MEFVEAHGARIPIVGFGSMRLKEDAGAQGDRVRDPDRLSPHRYRGVLRQRARGRRGRSAPRA